MIAAQTGGSADAAVDLDGITVEKCWSAPGPRFKPARDAAEDRPARFAPCIGRGSSPDL